jgi:hypothetical protein
MLPGLPPAVDRRRTGAGLSPARARVTAAPGTRHREDQHRGQARRAQRRLRARPSAYRRRCRLDAGGQQQRDPPAMQADFAISRVRSCGTEGQTRTTVNRHSVPVPNSSTIIRGVGVPGPPRCTQPAISSSRGQGLLTRWQRLVRGEAGPCVVGAVRAGWSLRRGLRQLRLLRAGQAPRHADRRCASAVPRCSGPSSDVARTLMPGWRSWHRSPDLGCPPGGLRLLRLASRPTRSRSPPCSCFRSARFVKRVWLDRRVSRHHRADRH